MSLPVSLAGVPFNIFAMYKEDYIMKIMSIFFGQKQTEIHAGTLQGSTMSAPKMGKEQRLQKPSKSHKGTQICDEHRNLWIYIEEFLIRQIYSTLISSFLIIFLIVSTYFLLFT
jgi:hypothetical protein